MIFPLKISSRRSHYHLAEDDLVSISSLFRRFSLTSRTQFTASDNRYDWFVRSRIKDRSRRETIEKRIGKRIAESKNRENSRSRIGNKGKTRQTRGRREREHREDRERRKTKRRGETREPTLGVAADNETVAFSAIARCAHNEAESDDGDEDENGDVERNREG